MNTHSQQKERAIVIALALLIHLIAVILLLSSEPRSRALMQLLLPEQMQKQEEWAATHAQKNAPTIFFKDEKPPAPASRPTQPTSAVAKAIADRPVTEKQQEIQPPVERKQEAPAPETKTVAEEQKPTTVIDRQESPDHKTATLADMHQPHAVPQQATPAPPEPPAEKLQPPQQPQPRQVAQQKTPTLEQITRAFFQEVAQTRAAEITMKGEREGHPTEEQLRIGRYAQKVLECLVGSYHRNRHNIPREYLPSAVSVDVAINRDGSLEQLDITQSSGQRNTDDFVKKLFIDASSGFPTLSTGFKGPLFLFRFNIPDLHALSSTAMWTFDK